MIAITYRLQVWLVRLALRSGLLSCQGKVMECNGKALATALDGQTASSTDINLVGPMKGGVFTCMRRRENCEVCPGFKEFRQQGSHRQLNVFSTPQGEANMADGHWKGAEVHDLNQQAFSAVNSQRPARSDSDLHTVVAERSPAVEQAQACAKNCDAKTNVGNGFGLHGTSVDIRIVQEDQA